MTTSRWIEIRYKCSCLDKEAKFQMSERHFDEDILDFMTRVQKYAGFDHRSRSPDCTSTTMEYLKVPVEGDTIGGATGGTA
jgi:hypothetical protein